MEYKNKFPWKSLLYRGVESQPTSKDVVDFLNDVSKIPTFQLLPHRTRIKLTHGALKHWSTRQRTKVPTDYAEVET